MIIQDSGQIYNLQVDLFFHLTYNETNYGKRSAIQMIKSMTGFGRCEIVTEEYKVSVEMKAVNHRYLDLSIKMPKKFNYFESAIRTLLKG